MKFSSEAVPWIDFRARSRWDALTLVNAIMRRSHGPVADDLDPYLSRLLYDHPDAVAWELVETHRDLLDWLAGHLFVGLSQIGQMKW